MIVDERMVTYIRSLERPENPVIEAIEQEALARRESLKSVQQSDFRRF